MTSHRSHVHLGCQSGLHRLRRYRWSTPIWSSLVGRCDPQRSSRSTCHQAGSIPFQALSLGRYNAYHTISKHLSVSRRQSQYSRHPFWVGPRLRINPADPSELAPTPQLTTPILKSSTPGSLPPQPVRVQFQPYKVEPSTRTQSAIPPPPKLPHHSHSQVSQHGSSEADK